MPLKFLLSRGTVIPVFSMILLLCSNLSVQAQQRDSTSIAADSTRLTTFRNDTIPTRNDTTIISKKDSVVSNQKSDDKKRVYVPRTAAIRSAILPGLGQIYNRKYWKLALVYGALGATGYVFFDNLKTYKESRFAYAARYKASQAPVPPLIADSTDYNTLSFEYKTLYTIESIRANRDQFRRYIDYSVLVFILFWGLNVVDATVDAHLKSFDVSPDLTMKFKAGHSEMAGTNGVSLVFTLKNHHGK